MCIYPNSTFGPDCGEVIASPVIWNSTNGFIDQVNMHLLQPQGYKTYKYKRGDVPEILKSCLITEYERCNCCKSQ